MGTPRGQGTYVPPGLPYGTRQAMEQAQASVPAPALRTNPTPQPPPQQGRPGPGGPLAIPTLAQILARPTNRPDEPVTAGVPTGPGPNVITSAPSQGSISAILDRAAQASGSDTLRELAQRAQAAGQ
jgi:hypothetical protein